MRKKLIYILCSIFFIIKINACESCNFAKENETRIQKLELENAILKSKVETYIAENDKKYNSLTGPIGLIITLLLFIFGIGAFRSVYLAKQEARKAFKEDFEKIKLDIENLKKEAEKELEEIVTFKEIAKSKVN
jgi:hypothetical protein